MSYTFEKNINLYENYRGQAYVAWQNNKGHNERGKKWSNNGKMTQVENTGFRLSFNQSANDSSQGGDLSFWNCDITSKDGETWLIGVNSQSLLELLKECTCINGVIQENVLFARYCGNVVCIKENGIQHEALLKNLKDKEEMGKQKAALKTTTKHVLGGVYSTKGNYYSDNDYNSNYLKEIYLGEWWILKLEKFNNGSSSSYSSSYYNPYHYSTHFLFFKNKDEGLDYIKNINDKNDKVLGFEFRHVYHFNKKFFSLFSNIQKLKEKEKEVEEKRDYGLYAVRTVPKMKSRVHCETLPINISENELQNFLNNNHRENLY